jgi:hypothetical protein
MPKTVHKAGEGIPPKIIQVILQEKVDVCTGNPK